MDHEQGLTDKEWMRMRRIKDEKTNGGQGSIHTFCRESRNLFDILYTFYIFPPILIVSRPSLCDETGYVQDM